MATVTITLKDTDDGSVKVAAAFDPPLKNDEHVTTRAQNAAGIMLEALSLVMSKD